MSKQDWTLQYLGIVVNFALHLALQCGIGLGWPSLWENKGRMRARTGCTAPQKENLMHESTKGKFCLTICWMKDVSRQINKVGRLRPLNHTKYLITQKKMLDKTQKFEDNFCFKLCCPLLKFLQRASFYNFHNLQHFHLSVKLWCQSCWNKMRASATTTDVRFCAGGVEEMWKREISRKVKMFSLCSTWAPFPNAPHERLQDNPQGSFLPHPHHHNCSFWYCKSLKRSNFLLIKSDVL